jgi:exonuclease SbcD
VRILHTSDWHLGRTLEGRDRFPEQVQFVDQLCDIAASEGVHLVLVAGDVFDTSNPPARAEELYFDALERLSDGGKRAVVVIAGNHDSPDRIRAANPLAVRHGISLVGCPGDDLGLGGPPNGAGRIRTGPGWMEIACPGWDESAFIVTLAYPSEARLNEVLAMSLEDKKMQLAYSERVARLVGNALESAGDARVRLVVGHLFTNGGRECDSERQIQLGGAFGVLPQTFATGADYVALGHLHRPQEITTSGSPCRYSGSPLSYSFSEADQQKEVVLVEIADGSCAARDGRAEVLHRPGGGPRDSSEVAPRRVTVKPIKLTCGKALKRWTPRDYEEALQWCRDPRNKDFWVDLEIPRDTPLTDSERSVLKESHEGLIHIRWRGTGEMQVSDEIRVSELPLLDRFKLFCRRNGGEASQELIDLFLELVNEDGKEESTDEAPQT